MIQQGLESSGSTCPAGVSVRFASLVGIRHSYQLRKPLVSTSYAVLTGWRAKRTAHGPSLGTTAASLARAPSREYAVDWSLCVLLRACG